MMTNSEYNWDEKQLKNAPNILPVTLGLAQALKILGWGRSKFFENIGHDADLRGIFFKEEGTRSKYTCYLHELMGYKEKYRVGQRPGRTKICL